MISDVGICNLALTKIGKQPIVSFDDENESARKCNILYNECLEELLSEHNWWFTTKIELLSELSGETVIGWDYLYIIPANCLKIEKVFDENNTDTNNYELILSSTTNSKIIATNLYQASIKYISTTSDSNLLDSLFKKALVARLASELAIPLTGDKAMATLYFQQYQLFISEAKKKNAQEKHVKISRECEYFNARA